MADSPSFDKKTTARRLAESLLTEIKRCEAANYYNPNHELKPLAEWVIEQCTSSAERAIPVTAIWLRRIGDYAEVLFERDGRWRMAIREHCDCSFSHIIETGGMQDCPLDTVAAPQGKSVPEVFNHRPEERNGAPAEAAHPIALTPPPSAPSTERATAETQRLAEASYFKNSVVTETTTNKNTTNRGGVSPSVQGDNVLKKLAARTGPLGMRVCEPACHSAAACLNPDNCKADMTWENKATPNAVERTPQDYAIEHGEYLAKSAERLRDAVNEYFKAREANVEFRIGRAEERLSEAMSDVRALVYEFTKRADRAKATRSSTAQPRPDDLMLMPRKLTAENGMKGAMIGEFSFVPYEGADPVFVPWDTIKAIYDRAVTHLGQRAPVSHERQP